MDASRCARVGLRAFDTNERRTLIMQRSALLIFSLLAACSRASEHSAATNVDVDPTTFSAVSAIAGASEAPRTIDKGDGLIVETLVQGDGPAVELGKTVTLEYTISYVPKPHDPSKDAKETKE